MIARGILRRCCRRSRRRTASPLWSRPRRAAGIAPEPVRRLAALLPADAGRRGGGGGAAAAVEAGGEAAGLGRPSRTLDAPEALAYRIGTAEAVDRFLLAGASRAPISQALRGVAAAAAARSAAAT